MKVVKTILNVIYADLYKSLMAAALVFVLALSVVNIFQRRAAVEELKQAGLSNRSMLNSRARIQIILINANLENRPLNNSEIDQIKQLWGRAEYDQADSSE